MTKIGNIEYSKNLVRKLFIFSRQSLSTKVINSSRSSFNFNWLTLNTIKQIIRYIKNYFWNLNSQKVDQTNCNGIYIHTWKNEPKMNTRPCSVNCFVICELNTTLARDMRSNAFDLQLDQLRDTIESSATNVTNDIKSEMVTLTNIIRSDLESFRSDFESIETCKIVRDVKTAESQMFEQQLAEKKATVEKLTARVDDLTSTLKTTANELTESKIAVDILRYELNSKTSDMELCSTKSNSTEFELKQCNVELVQVKLENASCGFAAN